MSVLWKYRWNYGIFILCVVLSSSHAVALSAQMNIIPDQGQVPLKVIFSDASGGNVVDWRWDFGDGYTGSGAYIMHTYEIPGVYPVTLTITNKEGERDSVLIQDAVVVLPHPFSGYLPLTYPKMNGFLADFTAIKTQGTAPLKVEFVDRSAGDPDSWHWDFGDGGTDTVQNPMHTYLTPGSYSVSLTTSKAGRVSRKEEINFITVSPGTGSVAYQSARNGTQPEGTRTGDTLSASQTVAKQRAVNGSVNSTAINPSLNDHEITGTSTDVAGPILPGLPISWKGLETPGLLMVQNEPPSILSGSSFTTTIRGFPDEEIFFWVSGADDHLNLANGTVPVISGLQEFLVFDETHGPYYIGDTPVSLNGKSYRIRDLIPIDPIYQGTRSYGQLRLNHTGMGEIEWNASDLQSGFYDVHVESVSPNSLSGMSIRKASASLQVL